MAATGSWNNNFPITNIERGLQIMQPSFILYEYGNMEIIALAGNNLHAENGVALPDVYCEQR